MSVKVDGQLLWDFCEDLVASGAGYVWGGRGKVYDEKEAKYLFGCYGTSSYNKKYYMETSMKRWGGKIVVDCSGLIEAFRVKYLDKTDSTANGLFKQCGNNVGTIDTLPANKRGILLFKKSGSTMGHVGVYGGDNTTIEALNSTKGVVKRDPMTKTAWTHWGIHPLIPPVTIGEEEDEKTVESAPYKVTNCYYLNVRDSASANGKRVEVLSSGTVVNVYGKNGGWLQIDKEGNKWCSGRYLIKLDKMEVVNCTELNVRNKPNAKGKYIRTLKKGETVYCYDVASTGWIKISPDKDEYCSNKYLKKV